MTGISRPRWRRARGRNAVRHDGRELTGNPPNGGETDDGGAGGPSWDQIMLKHAPALSRKDASGTIIGRGYYNSICDSAHRLVRDVDALPLLRLHEGVDPASASPGGIIQENQPLQPS